MGFSLRPKIACNFHQWTVDLFGDTAAIWNSVVSNSYYGMMRAQIRTNLPLGHPIIVIWNNRIQKGRRIAENVHFEGLIRPRSIYQYSNMAPRLSGQNCKFVNFLLSLNSQKSFGYKENTTKINIEVCPESLGAMLEYCYIERGLLSLKLSL